MHMRIWIITTMNQCMAFSSNKTYSATRSDSDYGFSIKLQYVSRFSAFNDILELLDIESRDQVKSPDPDSACTARRPAHHYS